MTGHVDSSRALDAWIFCIVNFESDTAGRQTLQVSYYLGTAGDRAVIVEVTE